MAIALLSLVSCSSTKHVPDGRLLLDDVKINILDEKKVMKQTDLINYLRQQPNHKVLGGMKLQLPTKATSTPPSMLTLSAASTRRKSA